MRNAEKHCPAVLLLSACVLIPYGRGVQKYLGVFFFGIAPYAQLKSQLFPFAPLICILWMAAVVLMLFGLFILCPKKETFLCQFGKNTIGIYILHRLFKDFLIYRLAFMSCSVQMAILPFWRLWCFPSADLPVRDSILGGYHQKAKSGFRPQAIFLNLILLLNRNFSLFSIFLHFSAKKTAVQ